MKYKVFQDDCFELDHDVLPSEIFISPKEQDLTHSNLLVFRVFFVFCFTTNEPNILIYRSFWCRGAQILSVECTTQKNRVLNYFKLYSPN